MLRMLFAGCIGWCGSGSILCGLGYGGGNNPIVDGIDIAAGVLLIVLFFCIPWNQKAE